MLTRELDQAKADARRDHCRDASHDRPGEMARAVSHHAGGGGQKYLLGEGRLLQMNRDGTAPPWNTPYRILGKVSKP